MAEISRWAKEGDKDMRMDRVRIGERLVLNDRGGVWQKIGNNKAKNIYGGEYGTEIDIPSDTPVYVHFAENRGGSRYERPPRAPWSPVPRRDDREQESRAGDTWAPCSAVPVEKRPLTEGMEKKGGVNERPASPKQEIKPPPQRPQEQEGKQQPSYGNLKEGIHILVLNDDEETVLEVADATSAQVMAYMNAESIHYKKDGKPVELKVMELAFGHDTQTVYIGVQE